MALHTSKIAILSLTVQIRTVSDNLYNHCIIVPADSSKLQLTACHTYIHVGYLLSCTVGTLQTCQGRQPHLSETPPQNE